MLHRSFIAPAFSELHASSPLHRSCFFVSFRYIVLFLKSLDSLQNLLSFLSKHSFHSNLKPFVSLYKSTTPFRHRTTKMAFPTNISFSLIFLATHVVSTQAYCNEERTQLCQYNPDCGEGKSIQNCVWGFAGGVSGSSLGKVLTVTDPSDIPSKVLKPNSLRYFLHVATLDWRGAHIVFESDMTIKLESELLVGGNVTIDGRGFHVKITGYPLVVMGSNVIIENLEIADSNSHAVSLSGGASYVWLDHLTISGAKVGSRVANGSRNVTISNCHFSRIDQNLILGDIQDENMSVTVFQNFFDHGVQKMPFCRFGYCHVANNYYKGWEKYAIGGGDNGRIYSEMNAFDPVKDALQVTPWYQGFKNDTSAIMESHNNKLLNGANFTWFKHNPLGEPPYPFFGAFYPLLEPTGRLPDLVPKCAGALYGAGFQVCNETVANTYNK